MIRILHVTEDHTFANTGVTSALDTIVRQLDGKVDQAIASIGTEAAAAPESVPVHLLPSRGPARVWRYAAGQRLRLARLVSQADIVHLHGTWMWIQWAAAFEAQDRDIPVLLTAHGFLQPWNWTRQSLPHRLKKRLYWKWMALPVYSRLSAIHALSKLEAVSLSGFLPGIRVEVIPHGLNLTQLDRDLQSAANEPAPDDPYFLFMGRLHPVKGIDLLIRAFAKLSLPEFKLKIAGPVEAREKEYADSLVGLVAELGIQDRVEFLGTVRGAQKWNLFRHARAVCQPSFTEAIGIVNLEAAAASAPVIASVKSGLEQAWAKEGGMLIQPVEAEIAHALAQAAAWTLAERSRRGQNLRRLVERCYSWDATAPQWMALYESLAKCAF